MLNKPRFMDLVDIVHWGVRFKIVISSHPIGFMYAIILMVTWIPSIYPSHVSIFLPAPWIRHGL